MSEKELFYYLLVYHVFNELLLFFVYTSFPFAFWSGMWDLGKSSLNGCVCVFGELMSCFFLANISFHLIFQGRMWGLIVIKVPDQYLLLCLIKGTPMELVTKRY